MYSLVHIDPTLSRVPKEAGPLIVALAFVIAAGGVAAAAILICGWQHVKSIGVNVSQKRVEIACK
jgi:hypothetical protein